MTDPTRSFRFAVLVAVAACTPAQTDDGFRAKLAAGCSTKADCDRLFARAEARLKACQDEQQQAVVHPDCSPLLEDKGHAARLQAAEEKRETDDREQARRDESQRKLDELRADRQRQVDDKKHRQQVASLLGNLRFSMQSGSGQIGLLQESTQPAALMTSIDDVNKKLEELRAVDPDEATKMEPDVAAWSTTVRSAVTAEEKCRASTECMGARAAAPVCDALERRRFAVQEMARERANPSGYVNTTYLHDLGQQIQDADAKLPELRKQYAAVAKKPFADAACKKP